MTRQPLLRLPRKPRRHISPPPRQNDPLLSALASGQYEDHCTPEAYGTMVFFWGAEMILTYILANLLVAIIVDNYQGNTFEDSATDFSDDKSWRMSKRLNMTLKVEHFGIEALVESRPSTNNVLIRPTRDT